MRLWHIDLIKDLPRQQLLGQWREIHAIIGTINKHGKVNHSVVNYVNDNSIDCLYAYALEVDRELIERGYKPNWDKLDEKFLNYVDILDATNLYYDYLDNGTPIYPEHDDKYMQECLDNLKNKGIIIRAGG